VKWVNSSGGPLLCAAESVSKSWMGTRGLSSPSPRFTSDYERACATTEYLEHIPAGTGDVLVLGDEPLQSAFVRASNNLMIARWMYAQSHDQANTILQGPIGEALELTAKVPFVVKEDRIVLLDSALAGSQVIDKFDIAHIEPGSYKVTTEKIEMKTQYSFIIHRFLRCA
jgi:Immunity protein 21